MKKFLIIVISLAIAICLSGCAITIKLNLDDVDDANQTLTFVDAEFYGFYDNREGVALFFEYTNDSGDSKCPGDGFIVVVHQNGKPADPLSVAEEIDGAITPGTSVKTGTTVRVAYLFILRDASSLSVTVSDGQKFTIEYDQIEGNLK